MIRESGDLPGRAEWPLLAKGAPQTVVVLSRRQTRRSAHDLSPGDTRPGISVAVERFPLTGPKIRSA